MTYLCHERSEPPEEEPTFESILLRHIADYRKAVTEGDSEKQKQHAKSIHDMLNTVTGEDYADMVMTFRAVVQLQDYCLTVAAIAAIGNLDDAAAPAVPVILEEGLRGDGELLRTASYALGSIGTRESLLALVELCKRCKNYKALALYTLPMLLSHGPEAQPFLSEVEEALNLKSRDGVDPIHLADLHLFRSQMRYRRAAETASLELPGELSLDILYDNRKRPVDDLEHLQQSELSSEQGQVQYDRLHFSLHGEKSEVGIAIYALSQPVTGHLVIFEQDETSYGEPVHSLVECLAAVVAVRYLLNPDTTWWASLTTRESGLVTRGKQDYALYTMVHDPTCDRYTNTRIEACSDMHALMRRLRQESIQGDELP